MDESSHIDRRTYLKTATALTAVGLLAGCTDANGQQPADDNGPIEEQEENGEEEHDEEENGEEEHDGEENGEEEHDGEENGEEEHDGEENGSASTVIVGPDGENIFEPAELSISTGTTVEFVWDSDTHNLALVDRPEDGWEGYDPIEDTGFEYEHTFEVEGTYEYVCEPHEAEDMYGTIVVD